MSAFPVMPGETWTVAGSNDDGAIRSAIYSGPGRPDRVVDDITLPYTFTPEEGETHVAWVITVPLGDPPLHGALYLDG